MIIFLIFALLGSVLAEPQNSTISGVGTNCTSDEDCKTINNSFCNRTDFSAEMKCSCKIGFYETANGCAKFAEELMEPCEDKQGCANIPNSNCRKGLCQCKKKTHRPDTNSCLALNSVSCNRTRDCYVSGAECWSKTCQCPEGFYERNFKCLPFAVRLGDICLHNESCSQIRGINCPNATDQHNCSLSGYVSQCVNGKCSCPDGYQRFGYECIKPEAEECGKGFFVADGRCRGHNGATCEVDADCGYVRSKCRKRKCECQLNHYLMDRACYPYAGDLGDWCDFPEACTDIKNADCINNRCQCPQLTHRQVSGFCRPRYFCSDPADCRKSEIICSNRLAAEPGGCCFLDETCRDVEVWSQSWYQVEVTRERSQSVKCRGGRCVCPDHAVAGYSGCFIHWYDPEDFEETKEIAGTQNCTTQRPSVLTLIRQMNETELEEV